MTNEPNSVSAHMAKEFPLLWAMANEFDLAERLGGCSSELHAEIDRALREIWDARNFMRDFPREAREGVG